MVKVENSATNSIELKEFATKKGAQTGASDMSERLLIEMKELREKYHQNFLELQNAKEKQNLSNEAIKTRQMISKTQQCIIESLASENKVLLKLSQTAEKLVRATHAEYTSTCEELLAAKNKIAKLESANTQPQRSPFKSLQVKSTPTAVKVESVESPEVKSYDIRVKVMPATNKASVSPKIPESERPTEKLGSANRRQRVKPARDSKSANSSMGTESTTAKDEEQSGICEVQQLVGHKTVRKIRYFKVRWQGFDAKSDTWVKENDLFCPGLLQTYKSGKKLK